MNRGTRLFVAMGFVACLVLTLSACTPKPPADSGAAASHAAPNTTSADGAPVISNDAPMASPEAQAHAAAAATPSSKPAATAASSAESPAAAVKIEGGTATIGPDNSKIVFIGTHKGEKPDPRNCGFERFSGKLGVDEASKSLKSVSVEIDTTSIWTQFGKLTNHLKEADFFEVKEYPTAKFESTKIEAGDAPDRVTIHGNLTLHGVTKEIAFPATVKIDGSGITLASQFDFNRSEYGMNLLTDRVDDKVSVSVAVGEKTAPLPPAG